jgi:hypothetical protein
LTLQQWLHSTSERWHSSRHNWQLSVVSDSSQATRNLSETLGSSWVHTWRLPHMHATIYILLSMRGMMHNWHHSVVSHSVGQ